MSCDFRHFTLLHLKASGEEFEFNIGTAGQPVEPEPMVERFVNVHLVNR